MIFFFCFFFLTRKKEIYFLSEKIEALETKCESNRTIIKSVLKQTPVRYKRLSISLHVRIQNPPTPSVRTSEAVEKDEKDEKDEQRRTRHGRNQSSSTFRNLGTATWLTTTATPEK